MLDLFLLHGHHNDLSKPEFISNGLNFVQARLFSAQIGLRTTYKGVCIRLLFIALKEIPKYLGQKKVDKILKYRNKLN